jgi:hypothetical protein
MDMSSFLGWEYCTADLTADKFVLERLGRDGWESYAIRVDESLGHPVTLAYLKRAVRVSVTGREPSTSAKA